MKKLLPVIIVFLVISAVGSALMSADSQAGNTAEYLTVEDAVKVFRVKDSIDIQLLQRIEAIEKKLKITPPKDSLRLEKKNENEKDNPSDSKRTNKSK